MPKKGLVKTPADYPKPKSRPSPGVYDGQPGLEKRTPSSGPPEKTFDTPPGSK